MYLKAVWSSRERHSAYTFLLVSKMFYMWKSVYNPPKQMKLREKFLLNSISCRDGPVQGIEAKQRGKHTRIQCTTLLWNDGRKEDKKTTLHLLKERRTTLLRNDGGKERQEDHRTPVATGGG